MFDLLMISPLFLWTVTQTQKCTDATEHVRVFVAVGAIHPGPNSGKRLLSSELQKLFDQRDFIKIGSPGIALTGRRARCLLAMRLCDASFYCGMVMRCRLRFCLTSCRLYVYIKSW
jgi:hypothetical protein